MWSCAISLPFLGLWCTPDCPRSHFKSFRQQERLSDISQQPERQNSRAGVLAALTACRTMGRADVFVGGRYVARFVKHDSF